MLFSGSTIIPISVGLNLLVKGIITFDQLESVFCPFCGSSLEEHARKKMCLNISGESVDIAIACRSEAAKTNTMLRDLEGTVSALETERNEVLIEIARLKQIVDGCDSQISEELRPKQISEQSALDQLLIYNSSLSERESNFRQLNELKAARELIKPPTVTSVSTKASQSQLDTFALRKLGDIIEEVLREWKYPGVGTVEFSEQQMDFVVNGKPRQSNGKGVRALMYAAFAISLMRFCKNNDLPHPSFVILDSPVTTFREGAAEVFSENVLSEIEGAFFESLAKTPDDQQIIILENKEPSIEVQSKINYLEFKKLVKGARKGFYPLLTH